MAQEHPGSGNPRFLLWLAPALLVVLGGAATGVIRHYAGTPGEPESRLSDLAFAAPSCLAGALAVLGMQEGHRGSVIGAGFALIPISLVSVVMWPLLIAAIFLVSHGVAVRGVSRATDGAETCLVAVGLPLAFFSLLVHQDPVTWQTNTGSGGASDVVTDLEAVISLSVTAAVAGASMLLVWLTPNRGALVSRSR